MCWTKIYWAAYTCITCCGVIKFVASVVVLSWSYVPSFCTVCGMRSFLGALYTIVFVLVGARGVLLKSKFPCRYAYADNYGLARDILIMLRVSSTCLMRRSQSFNGNSLAVVHYPAMR